MLAVCSAPNTSALLSERLFQVRRGVGVVEEGRLVVGERVGDGEALVDGSFDHVLELEVLF